MTGDFPEELVPPTEPGDDERPTAQDEQKLSASDWKILDEVHSGLGHCPNKTLVRVLKSGRARPELVKAAASWRCASCETRSRPLRPRPSQPALTLEFNDILGLDLIFILNDKRTKVPALNLGHRLPDGGTSR